MSKLTQNAIKILEKRYLKTIKNEDGTERKETPEEMFRRVANCVAAAERIYLKDNAKVEEIQAGYLTEDGKNNNLLDAINSDIYIKSIEDKFFDMMSNLDFLPNSPTLMNANSDLGQLAACFVLPLKNDIREILKTLKQTALIHKSGGGTGFNFSNIDCYQLSQMNSNSETKIKFIINPEHPDLQSILEKQDELKNVEIEVSELKTYIKSEYHSIDDTLEDLFSFEILLDKPELKFIDFSQIRSEGSTVLSTQGVASGPLSFMRVWDKVIEFLSHKITPISTIKMFDAATEAVKQGGVRRGANMGILNIDNPYIREFISCKENNNDINNFNLSVGIVNGFWECYTEAIYSPNTEKKDFLWELKDGTSLNPVVIMDDIITRAHLNGEPGIIFLDVINEEHPIVNEEIEATNPCGEQPLLPYECCNLGSINLVNMIYEESHDVFRVDTDKLEKTVRTAVRFLDNVIDVNKYPLPEIEAMAKKYRKIGLGVMGWAHMLYKMKIPYNSTRALDLAHEIASMIQIFSKNASIDLGRERGSFPGLLNSVYCRGSIREGMMRNVTRTTIAPTGTLSIIASVSSGIEPEFALAYIRNAADNELEYVNPLFDEELKRVLERNGEVGNPLPAEKDPRYLKILSQVATTGTLEHIDEIPEEEIRKVFVTAHDVEVDWHVRHQAAWQIYNDNAVSKTINMRNDAKKDDVYNAYVMARKLGCKGITVYRDGSRDSQVLNIKSVEEKKQEEPKCDSKCWFHEKKSNEGKTEMNGNCRSCWSGPDAKGNCTFDYEEPSTIVKNEVQEGETALPLLEIGKPRPRPEVLDGLTQKIKSGCGNLYITVNWDVYGIFEVFAITGQTGGCPSQTEATCRIVSLALRSGIPVSDIVKQLRGIKCTSTIRQKGLNVTSCGDAIARFLEWVQKEKINKPIQVVSVWDPNDRVVLPETITTSEATDSEGNLINIDTSNPAEYSTLCPECKTLQPTTGKCFTCKNCGFSKCG